MQNLLVGKEISIRVESNEILENASFSISLNRAPRWWGQMGLAKVPSLKFLEVLICHLKEKLFVGEGFSLNMCRSLYHQKFLRLTPVQALEKRIAEVNPNVEDWRLYETLSLLNLPDHCLEIPLGALSGGEANKVLLGRALVVNPDIVLLDEPTNHMDSEAILEFENFSLTMFMFHSYSSAMIDNF